MQNMDILGILVENVGQHSSLLKKKLNVVITPSVIIRFPSEILLEKKNLPV